MLNDRNIQDDVLEFHAIIDMTCYLQLIQHIADIIEEQLTDIA